MTGSIGTVIGVTKAVSGQRRASHRPRQAEKRRALFNPQQARCLPQPLHGEFDIRRLQVAPAFDLGLISILRVRRAIGRAC